jgi:hypothetical protein
MKKAIIFYYEETDIYDYGYENVEIRSWKSFLKKRRWDVFLLNVNLENVLENIKTLFSNKDEIKIFGFHAISDNLYMGTSKNS